MVSGMLGIDYSYAKNLLSHFNSSFKIDDPLLWLKNLVHENEKIIHLNQLHYEKLHLGEDISEKDSQLDTAEYRKQKERKFHPKKLLLRLRRFLYGGSY